MQEAGRFCLENPMAHVDKPAPIVRKTPLGVELDRTEVDHCVSASRQDENR
jgi:hypothetical protein